MSVKSRLLSRILLLSFFLESNHETPELSEIQRISKNSFLIRIVNSRALSQQVVNISKKLEKIVYHSWVLVDTTVGFVCRQNSAHDHKPSYKSRKSQRASSRFGECNTSYKHKPRYLNDFSCMELRISSIS